MNIHKYPDNLTLSYEVILMPIGDMHKTGEINPESGVYRNMMCTHPGGAYEIPLSKGERFPPCRSCNGAVTWKLVRYA